MQIYINIFLLKNVELWLNLKYLLKTLQGIKTGTRASKTKGKFSWKVEKNGGEMWSSHTWSRFKKAENYWAYWYFQVKSLCFIYLFVSVSVVSEFQHPIMFSEAFVWGINFSTVCIPVMFVYNSLISSYCKFLKTKIVSSLF